MSPVRRVLIVRASAIGDFVLNLPALRAIVLEHPDTRFTLVGYPETLELARLFAPVESVHSIELEPWSRLFHSPLPGLRFDRAFVWMKDAAFAENLRRSGIPNVVNANPFPAKDHAAAHLLSTLGLSAPELPDLWIPGSQRVLVHPGSGGKAKCWPRFAELTAVLDDVAAVIGPCETQFPGNCPRIAGRLDVIAEELRHCRAFVGNDSGITHLAAYLGCPTVALFGPTDPRIWSPLGRRVRVLWKPSMEDFSVEEVLSEIGT